jgi:putrescine transport system substrate-binding protein
MLTPRRGAAESVDASMRNNPDIYLDDATYERLIPGKDIPQSDMRARMRTWTKFKTATAK